MARRVAVIGAGAIGAGWAARYLRAGWTVELFDPTPSAAEARVQAIVQNTAEDGPVLQGALGTLQVWDSLRAAVRGVDWVQESVPDRVALKRTVYAAIQAESRAPIASSSDAHAPVELQTGALRPAEIFVARPSFPVQVMPLVEIEVSGLVPDPLIDQAVELYRGLGMAPVHLRGTAAGARGAAIAASVF